MSDSDGYMMTFLNKEDMWKKSFFDIIVTWRGDWESSFLFYFGVYAQGWCGRTQCF